LLSNTLYKEREAARTYILLRQTEETGFSFITLRSKRCRVEKQPYFQEHPLFPSLGKRQKYNIFLVRNVGHTGCGTRYPFANAIKNI